MVKKEKGANIIKILYPLPNFKPNRRCLSWCKKERTLLENFHIRSLTQLKADGIIKIGLTS